ncbi:MAG TPA: glucose-6-phosphate dehydrogenase, partial [Paludibacteraceae bacterium]|nr:glucose-6-phosphate dehydrogenase [Paludibacteraceae bacterium]
MDDQKVMPTKNNIEGQMLVIFGSNGDLARRKLLPSIFQLHADKLLPENFAIIGTGSQEKEQSVFRQEVEESLKKYVKDDSVNDDQTVREFLKKVYYLPVRNQVEEDFGKLKDYLHSLSTTLNIPRNIIYYFSIPPFLYEVVASNLVKYGLNRQKDGWK